MGGMSMVEDKAGTIVWVQRKNGSWWPGRVMSLSELSALASTSDRFSPSQTNTPIKLLGRQEASVDWFNLETSKHVKSFRCGEFDDCIERAECFLTYPSTKFVINSPREVAILHALQLEKQEMYGEQKRPGDKLLGTICRAKRSKCVYLPSESKTCSDRTVVHSQLVQVSSFPSGMEHSSLKSGSAEEDTSSSQYETIQPSGNNSCQHGSLKWKYHDELCYQSNYSLNNQKEVDTDVKNWKVTKTINACTSNKKHALLSDEKSHFRSKSKLHNGDQINSGASYDGHSFTAFDNETEENLVWEVNTFLSAPEGGYLEDPNKSGVYSEFTSHQNSLEMKLIDVELTVQKTYPRQHVPLVCLMSKLNGKAIVGHPIEIETSVESSSDILPPGEGDVGHNFFTNGGTAMHGPVWRTSKRTPVCYVTPVASTSKNDKVAQACQTTGNGNLKAEGRHLTLTQNYFGKPAKKPCIFKPRKCFSSEKEHGDGGMQLKPEVISDRITCIPVKLVHLKLLGALGMP